MDPALTNLEQVEIQNYIKRYQNLTPTQLQTMLREAAEFTDPQEQNLPLQKALVFLLEQSNPAPQVDSDEALAAFLTQQNAGRNTHPRLKKRLIVVAAVLSALLILTAVAYAVQCWHLFQNVQEDFTQPRTIPGPEAIIKNWTGLPIPTYTPENFYISDAISGDGITSIEYSNSEGRRFSIFYYDVDSSVQMDSEKADQATQFMLED